MNDSYLLVHFGELSTKGNNKKRFIECLDRNVRHALREFPALTYRATHDHIYVGLGDVDPAPVIAKLSQVPGIQRISLAEGSETSLEAIREKALAMLLKEGGKSFKIDVKRIDKSYPLSSYDLTCQVADYVLDHSSYSVDVHHPDVKLRIDVQEGVAYLHAHDYPGAGGYPLGMNGKVLLLLSGGIDSPVAAYSLLRRGIKVEAIHFASPPYTSDRVIDKLTDLLGVLNTYQEKIKLNVVPFTKLQNAIYRYVDEPYCITIMRRMMTRIAVGVAKKERCLALATGESIGQVASQTLESLQTINEVTNFPILRPLATEDKVSIIAKAKEIGTFDISIRPYEDCCTIFKPKKPKTRPKLSECRYYESKFDWEPLVEECIASYSPLFVEDGEVKKPSKKPEEEQASAEATK